MLKGEILLANGSRVLFNAGEWEFSRTLAEGYSLKAKEVVSESLVMAWDPAKGDHFTTWKVSKDEYGHSPLVELSQQEKFKKEPQQSRWAKTPDQHVSINVHLTEEGKRAVKEAVLGKVENKHSKPSVSSDDWDKRVKTQHHLLEEMYKVLLEYVETFPREYELRDKAYPLINCVYENLKEWGDKILASEKEPAKKQKTYSFMSAIDEARKVQGYYSPAVITNGDIVVRCHVAHQARYIIFKNKECIGMHRHTDDIVDMHDIDIFKGWYHAEPDDATWARAQSLSGLIDKLKSPKKQEESTALFDVIGRAVLQHSGRVFTASHAGNFRISCNVMKNSWNVREHSTIVLENESRKTVEEFAQKRCINLKSGWHLFGITGLRG